jgi:D-arabinose 1-dehydrogenase-like Zn-dependent alcohol dehydrogenase
VVAFSSTASKREEALRLGAKHFVVSKDSAKLSVPRKLDHLLVTTGALPDWNSMLPLLAAEATVYPLTVRSRLTTAIKTGFTLNASRSPSPTSPYRLFLLLQKD